ncbi:hypothetical protein DSO57_1009427 [Entomophthora muscae]|uniref:Uncharacterized protein n=1 Tax=Entomophthora muscae TaxID=34485 RepID=A0ACC2SVN7_9FUNG|nr:hypothetical protein DSO57_1009427 [Entomophthora muscae]
MSNFMNATNLSGSEWALDCPSATSCTGSEDSCCIPDMGKMVLAVQWVVNQPIEEFTLHGLWPGDCETGMGPWEGCKVGATSTGSDVDYDVELKADMEKYWVSDRNDNQGFWDHEWNKHGTCLSTVREECSRGKEDGPPHIRYFKTSLKEYKKYKVYDELTRNSVVPREEPYSLSEILNALQKWESTFKLKCVNGRLNQIYFYSLGASANRFIQRSFFGTHNCPQKIYYPLKGSDEN